MKEYSGFEDFCGSSIEFQVNKIIFKIKNFCYIFFLNRLYTIRI